MTDERPRSRLLLALVLITVPDITTPRLGAGVLSPTAPSVTAYYVATTGSDSTGTGTATAPWATPAHAVDQIVARGLNVGMTTDVEVRVGAGTYWDTAIAITDAANPTNGHKLTLKAANGVNTVRLVGGHAVDTSTCAVYSGSVYRCTVPASADFWTLSENGVRAQAARTPNIVVDPSFPLAPEPFLTASNSHGSSYTQLTYQVGDLSPAGWVATDVRVWGPEGPGWRWFTGMMPVTSINGGTRLIFWADHSKYDSSSRKYVVQNDLSFVDVAGEWYLDRADAHGAPASGHYLYYYPRSTPVTSQELVYPTTSDALTMFGADAAHPVTGWVIDGLTIETSDFAGEYVYAAWGECNSDIPGTCDPTICDPLGPHAGPGCRWVMEAALPAAQHGLIHLRNVQAVTFSRVHAKLSGFSALYGQLAVTGVTIRDSWFERCGYDCIQFEGGYPGEGDINRDHVIYDVKLNNMGELLQHGAGIRLGNSGHNTLSRLSISQGQRNAIYITDMSEADSHAGYAIGNDVSYVAVDHVCQDTGDVGAIGVFSLGSTAVTTAPKPSNTFAQITVDSTAAHPGVTDAAPVCVYTDNDTYGQVFSNINCTNTQGVQHRNNASGGHTETNVSWNGGFNAALMSPAIGLAAEYPY